MKRLVGLVGALLLAAVVPAQAQDIVLKFGHAASSKHLFQTGLEIFAKKVAAKTGGKVEIEVYGDRQLGDDKQLLEGLQIGVIDGALVSSATLPLVIGASAFDALQLPFVVGSYGQLAKALGSPIGQRLLDTLEAKQIKGLGFIEAGQRHFLSRDKQISTLADFAGEKTRIVPIPLHKATWEAVGVNPIGLAYGEVYSALETGTIDAVEINLSSVQSESLYESAKHVTLTGHYFWPGVIMMSGVAWQKLPADIQAALVEAGKEATQEEYALAAKQESETAEFLRGKGVEIGKLTDLAEMRARTQPVVDRWLTKDPLIQAFYDQIKSEQ
ncbi:tripartite ATP-independent transporter solute receptor, DctP family [Tistlia consotensis]|uniref:Tripartite ATP-independent transporter solute receptor, DctP family n=1 Tax=Tistlia consotensis USBA 355 TaxID=560819 RepID=A0A1Y6BD87_9PROT|nr:TRAP transporter substrate-binding protein [Tistlia consotensis]SME98626.1 tripartite ATP-independent transporter solute receptor, DctP family [Tistlia consotensis USBA 355]SNR58005.1 tripartite ATP-independent transporter solute receptor, DctP family [Tistlia consotensis]